MVEDGGDVPAALLNKPEIEEGLAWYLQAFWDLTGDRQIGAMGGAGSIPFTAIDCYASRYEIEGLDGFDRFKTIVRALDAEYLKHLGEKAKAKEKETRKPLAKK